MCLDIGVWHTDVYLRGVLLRSNGEGFTERELSNLLGYL
jgi:hypothetical protein